MAKRTALRTQDADKIRAALAASDEALAVARQDNDTLKTDNLRLIEKVRALEACCAELGKRGLENQDRLQSRDDALAARDRILNTIAGMLARELTFAAGGRQAYRADGEGPDLRQGNRFNLLPIVVCDLKAKAEQQAVELDRADNAISALRRAFDCGQRVVEMEAIARARDFDDATRKANSKARGE